MTLQWLVLQAYCDVDQDNIFNMLILGHYSTVTEDFISHFCLYAL